jgi:hypothetical protein
VSTGSAGIAKVTVRNADNGATAILIPTYGKDAPKGWRAAGKPVFAFECADGRCMLRTLWTGSDLATYRFPGQITPRADKQVAELLVTLVKTE